MNKPVDTVWRLSAVGFLILGIVNSYRHDYGTAGFFFSLFAAILAYLTNDRLRKLEAAVKQQQHVKKDDLQSMD